MFKQRLGPYYSHRRRLEREHFVSGMKRVLNDSSIDRIFDEYLKMRRKD
jgi:hypothetical protein